MIPQGQMEHLLSWVAFVLGFSFVFITLGLAFSALSQFFYDTRDILAKIGGAVIILLGCI